VQVVVVHGPPPERCANAGTLSANNRSNEGIAAFMINPPICFIMIRQHWAALSH